MKRKTRYRVFAKGPNVSFPYPVDVTEKVFNDFLESYKDLGVEPVSKEVEEAVITGYKITDGDTVIWLRKTKCKPGFSIKM